MVPSNLVAGGIGKSVPRTLFAHVQIPRARDKKTGKQKKTGAGKILDKRATKRPPKHLLHLHLSP